jgi:hypothetical protein
LILLLRCGYFSEEMSDCLMLGAFDSVGLEEIDIILR